MSLSSDHHQLTCLILQKSHRVPTPDYEIPRFDADPNHFYVFQEVHLSQPNSISTINRHSLQSVKISSRPFFQSIFAVLPRI